MTFKNLILLLVVLSSISCQDVIELELSGTDIKPVISASITDGGSPITVSITRSSEFYNNDQPEAITEAEVNITDENGVSYSLTTSEPGIYTTTELEGTLGATYKMEIKADGNDYQATATIPKTKVEIDSITFEFEEETLFGKEGFYPKIYFTDPASEENYYRFIFLVNGQPFNYAWDEEGEDPELDSEISLYRDKYSNGGLQDYDVFYHLKKGDELTVELQHLDEPTYSYLRTLRNVSLGVGVAPADPISNFGTSALGHFSAYTTDVFTAIVE